MQSCFFVEQEDRVWLGCDRQFAVRYQHCVQIAFRMRKIDQSLWLASGMWRFGVYDFYLGLLVFLAHHA